MQIIGRDRLTLKDMPIGATYKCKKCHKIITEHIWVGNGWRKHVESYHNVRVGVKKEARCRCSEVDCEINHRYVCDGQLVEIKKGRTRTTNWDHKLKIAAKRIVDNLFTNDISE